MRIPPKIRIAFEKQGLCADIFEISITNAKFRVKDRHDQTIKKEVKMTEITLDARL